MFYAIFTITAYSYIQYRLTFNSSASHNTHVWVHKKQISHNKHAPIERRLVAKDPCFKETGYKNISYIKTVFLSPKRSAIISMWKKISTHSAHVSCFFTWQQNTKTEFHSRSIYSRCLFTLNGGCQRCRSFFFTIFIAAAFSEQKKSGQKIYTWKNETNSIIWNIIQNAAISCIHCSSILLQTTK